VTAEAERGEAPFLLFALQLQADYQIRDNAPFDSLEAMIESVVASFARAAAPTRRLIVKLHPLDNGLFDWPAVVRRAAARHGLDSRVTPIDGGRLDALIRHADGVVVANSTVGLHAIRAGTPVAALGEAVYRMPGLTHEGPLDRFWETPAPVDASLARDFVRALAAVAQVRGSFYHPRGRREAATEIVRRIAAGGVQRGPAHVDPPPRLPLRAHA
jgi:capsular polysaccharide export protein